MFLGHIDLIDRDTIRGWAADTARPDSAVEVAIFVNGRLADLARADQVREDLKDSAALGSSRHGIVYAFDPPLPGNEDHEVVVRFADGGKLLGQWQVAAMPDVDAPASPLTAPPAGPSSGQVPTPPVRRMESGALPGEELISFVDECSRTSVKGWAASATNPDAVFDVSIFVDDRKVGQVAADIPRDDLSQTGRHGNGARGFFHRFDPPLPDRREVRVTVAYARTGVPLTNGEVRLVGDMCEPIPPLPPLPEDEPRLLPPPAEPRALFEFLGLNGSEEGLSRLLSRLAFDGTTPEEVHYSVFGAYPSRVSDAMAWGSYYAHDHLYELLRSDAFQQQLIPLFLRAFPEKRRLIFVHIPKCAGTDLIFHLRTRFPSLDRSLTDADWTSKQAMLRRIARVVAHAHASDSVFVHGHINLADHIAADLIRPSDRVFTIVREPLAAAVSQINYILTRFDRDIAAGKAGPDTAEWASLMRLGSLPARMSGALVSQITKAALRHSSLVPPNPLVTWLGGGDAQAVLDRLTKYHVQVTDTTRYNAWLAQEWGIAANTRWNESKKFIAVDDLATDDLTHLETITTEDRRLYRALQEQLDVTGGLALDSHDLRGMVAP